MKYSKQAVLARFHKLPELRFEDQKLTSFGGVIVFQVLFQRLHLKARLKQCPTCQIKVRHLPFRVYCSLQGGEESSR